MDMKLKEIYENDRLGLDVIEKQSDFVTESSRLRFIIESLHGSNEKENMEFIKNYIVEFCGK